MRPLTPELARWLSHEAAQQALAALATRDLRDGALMPLLRELRQRFSEEEAAALVDQARLRQRAHDKFGALAATMLFTDEALQQASGLAIARYRARRYGDHVADLGCGIGGDAIALALRGLPLLAIERDPVRAILATHNLGAVGASATVVDGDWTRYPFPDGLRAAFADPARRQGGRRRFSLHTIEPPLAALQAVRQPLPDLGVKVMPGVPDEELPPDAEVEFIAEGGTCKEAVLWFGGLRRGPARQATIVQGESAHTLTSDDPAPPVAISEPRGYLLEPDPAVIRATLVAALAHRLDATQLDAQIAYLLADAPTPTPFARAWPILEGAPFNLKALNQRLKARQGHVLAVKKRGSPIEPEAFRRRLISAPDGEPVVVVITRHRDQPWMLLCGPMVGTASP